MFLGLRARLLALRERAEVQDIYIRAIRLTGLSLCNIRSIVLSSVYGSGCFQGRLLSEAVRRLMPTTRLGELMMVLLIVDIVFVDSTLLVNIVPCKSVRFRAGTP